MNRGGVRKRGRSRWANTTSMVGEFQIVLRIVLNKFWCVVRCAAQYLALPLISLLHLTLQTRLVTSTHIFWNGYLCWVAPGWSTIAVSHSSPHTHAHWWFIVHSHPVISSAYTNTQEQSARHNTRRNTPDNVSKHAQSYY